MSIAKFGHRLHTQLHSQLRSLLDFRSSAASHPHAHLYTSHARTTSSRWYESTLDKGIVPDNIIRLGIRAKLRAHARTTTPVNTHAIYEHNREMIEKLRTHPISIDAPPEHAHHNKVTSAFYEMMLGPTMLDTAAYWRAGVCTLDDASDAMHERTAQSADIRDGMSVLVLGARWGSLAYWLAKQYPDTAVTAVTSTTRSQQYIETQCDERDIFNVTTVCAQPGTFATDDTFDRIIIPSGFGQMQNLELPMERASRMLTAEGSLFVQTQAHRSITTEENPGQTWLSRNFTHGGITPAADLLANFQRCAELRDWWQLPGDHMEKTANAWLANLDANEPSIMYIFRRAYGPSHATTWFNRWRVYCMAIAEQAALARGSEWITCQYLFEPRPARTLNAPIVEVVRQQDAPRERAPKLFSKSLAG